MGTRRVDPASLKPPPEAVIAAREYAQAAQGLSGRLNDKYNGNGEAQRNRMMTKQERVREAISLMTGRCKEYNDFKAGRDTTVREAEKKAREIASKALGERV